jgi:hypothetical protein
MVDKQIGHSISNFCYDYQLFDFFKYSCGTGITEFTYCPEFTVSQPSSSGFLSCFCLHLSLLAFLICFIFAGSHLLYFLICFTFAGSHLLYFLWAAWVSPSLSKGTYSTYVYYQARCFNSFPWRLFMLPHCCAFLSQTMGNDSKITY